MDNPGVPPASTFPAQPLSSRTGLSYFSAHKKKFIIAGGVLTAVVIVILIFASGNGTNTNSTNNNDQSGIIQDTRPTPAQDIPEPTQAAIDVSETTNKLIEAAQSNTIPDTVDSLTIAVENPQLKDNLVAFYQKEQSDLSDDGVYNPTLAENGIQVYGKRAQILLNETYQGKPVQIRRDLVYTRKGWIIEDTKYNKPLDLKQQYEAQTLEDTLVENAKYSEKPLKVTLPNGDVLEIFRTYWVTGANPYDNTGLIANTSFNNIGQYDFAAFQDFIFLLSNPKQDYTIVLFDAPYIRHIKNIKANTIDGNYGPYHSFDIREVVEEDGKALILVYEGSLPIHESDPGVPDGWVLSVPLWIR